MDIAKASESPGHRLQCRRLDRLLPNRKSFVPKSSILMLITNLTFGGAQRVFYDHSRLLGQRHDVTEVMFNLVEGHAFPTGNDLLSLDVPGGGGPLVKAIHFVQRVRNLTAIKRRLRPVLTISHLEGAHYVSLLSRMNDKKIFVIHGSLIHDRALGRIKGFVIRRLLVPLLHNRADRIVTVSRDLVSELVSLGVRRDKIVTINNFFDPAAIRARSLEPLSSAEQALFGGPPVLVTSGRLTLQKNQAAMIALFADLLKRRPARLLLLGDGELRVQLIDQAKTLGLRVGEGPDGVSDIVFMGFQDNPFRLQRHADLFLLTSSWEGFPMVLGEAMACGLPIVSADCPTGPREFLAPDTVGHVGRPLRQADTGEYGLLLPIPIQEDVASIRSWVDSLDDLLGDELARRRMTAQSLARAEDFTLKTTGAQWLSLVDELLASTPATSA